MIETTDLETSQKLKDLGCKQESYFLWLYTEPMSTDVKYGFEPRQWSIQLSSQYHQGWEGRTVAAYTLSEVLDMLGERLVALHYPCEETKGKWFADAVYPYAGWGPTPLKATTALLEVLLEAKK